MSGAAVVAIVLAAPAPPFPLWPLLRGRGTTALLPQRDEREQFLEARA